MGMGEWNRHAPVATAEARAAADTACGTVVTFGEAMLRLTPPGRQRLEQANAFELWVAGAELNVAVALARLGEPAAWVSCLPDNPLGRRVAAHARANGVVTDGIRWSSGDRLGLMFVEVGERPRPSATLYDREGSAFASLDTGMLDWTALLDGARAFHTTGITAALSPACGRATVEALDAARAAGCHTSFDLNFRARLTTAEEARDTLHALAPRIDTLIASAAEVEALFGLDGDPAGAAAAVRDELGVERVVVSSRVDAGSDTQTRRSVSVDGEVIQAESVEFSTVDPLGGGDAFSAGFLAGLLAEGPARGLEVGGALAALKQSIPGDFAIVGPEDVEHLLASGGAGWTRR
jgi:2-dehydro-3-deoxygluconokinase